MSLSLMEQLANYLNLNLICIATYNTKEPYEYYYGYEIISNFLSGVYFIEKKIY